MPMSLEPERANRASGHYWGGSAAYRHHPTGRARPRRWFVLLTVAALVSIESRRRPNGSTPSVRRCDSPPPLGTYVGQTGSGRWIILTASADLLTFSMSVGDCRDRGGLTFTGRRSRSASTFATKTAATTPPTGCQARSTDSGSPPALARRAALQRRRHVMRARRDVARQPLDTSADNDGLDQRTDHDQHTRPRPPHCRRPAHPSRPAPRRRSSRSRRRPPPRRRLSCRRRSPPTIRRRRAARHRSSPRRALQRRRTRPSATSAPPSAAPALVATVADGQVMSRRTHHGPGRRLRSRRTRATATLHSTPRLLGTLTADESGAVRLAVTVTIDDGAGSHDVVFVGERSGTVAVRLIATAQNLPATR